MSKLLAALVYQEVLPDIT